MLLRSPKESESGQVSYVTHLGAVSVAAAPFNVEKQNAKALTESLSHAISIVHNIILFNNKNINVIKLIY